MVNGCPPMGKCTIINTSILRTRFMGNVVNITVSCEVLYVIKNKNTVYSLILQRVNMHNYAKTESDTLMLLYMLFE